MVLLAVIGTQVSAAAASRGVAGLVAAGYEMIDIQWKVVPVPGGQPVHLNGTVQDIIAKLTKLNPNWETDHKKYLANDTAADVEKRESTQTGVKKIKDEGRWDPDPCKGMDSECDAYDIMDGVDYLNKVPVARGT
ncbi:hypothetical protein BLS_002393 [Venturia inaequalis]|uniref:Uncharacterized protein n=1 Tax=Venturia inaequalis TaxID=5025 RepID=A0A8H3UUK9_VENIN|nr:hypothetical protein BLS_002393 [Venturia inaequalis]